MNAYLIAGHGSEPAPGEKPEEPSRVYDPTKPTPSKFVVPDGCTIIVHKQPYELAKQRLYQRAVRALMRLPEEVLTHPSDYSDDIIEAIGSIAIPMKGGTRRVGRRDKKRTVCGGTRLGEVLSSLSPFSNPLVNQAMMRPIPSQPVPSTLQNIQSAWKGQTP